MSATACEFCKYFAQLPNGETGRCRRFPPQGRDGFPRTYPEWSCGEFSQKPLEPKQPKSESQEKI